MIDEAKDIRKKKLIPNFRGDTNKNIIQYNPEFSDIKKEYLIFPLLHEDGHIVYKDSKKIQNWMGKAIWVLITSIPLVLFLRIYFPQIICYAILLAISLPAIFIISIRLNRKKFYKNEYRADEYAYKKIKGNFNTEKPSELAKKSLEAVKENSNPNLLIKIVSKLAGSLHPSIEERYEALKKIDD